METLEILGRMEDDIMEVRGAILRDPKLYRSDAMNCVEDAEFALIDLRNALTEALGI